MPVYDANVDLPPLDDPYYVKPAPPPPPERATFLAAASIASALLLGPIGALAAIAFGASARGAIKRGEGRPGQTMRLATAGLALGATMLFAWTGAGAFAAWKMTRVPEASVTPVDPIELSQPPAPPTLPGSPPYGTTDPTPSGTVPKSTQTKHVGAVTLVDIGVSSMSLQDELAKQRAEAAQAGESLLVMTMKGDCVPCRGFDASVKDPLMQTALAKVRVVRVDIDVFREDLDQLKIDIRRYPGFFLLALDLTPRDGIDGGEWDDDIPQNIAPVIGAFMKGKYVTRRQKFQKVPEKGTRL